MALLLVTRRRPALPVIACAGDIDDPPRLNWVDCVEQSAIHLEPADAILLGARLCQAATECLWLREMDDSVGVRTASRQAPLASDKSPTIAVAPWAVSEAASF